MQNEIKEDFETALPHSHSEPQARLMGIHAPAHLRLVRRLDRCIAGPARKQAHRLADCQRTPALYRDKDSGDFLLSRKTCKHRMCPSCGDAKLARMRKEAEAIVEKLDSPKFLTLTIASNDTPLADQLRRLRQSFSKLRRSKLWKRNYTRGISVVEVTFNQRTARWHPHLHVIIDGKYVPQDKLSDAWLVATGDSKIVHIRAVPSRKDAVRYVCKYAQKAAEIEEIPDGRLPELLAAFHGLRTHSLIGPGCRRIVKRPEPLAKRSIEPITQLHEIHRDARAGKPAAVALVKLVYKLRGRDVPRTPPGATQDPQSLHGQIAQLLRAWIGAWSADRGLAAPENTHHPPAVSRDDRRPVRLWEESDAPLVGLID